MSRRCPQHHPVPVNAVFYPECWAVLPTAPPPRGRVSWRVWTAGLLAMLLAGWAAWQWSHGGFRPRGAIERVRAMLPAAFTIELRDLEGWTVSQGSGFLVDSSGRAVTAFHVLRGAARAVARFEDGRLYEVLNVTAWDSLADVAVFEVGRAGAGGVQHPRASLYPALRTRPRASMGEAVMVIGSPEGFESTLSDGLVSGTRTTEWGERLQLTAPISSGSSGGPVFDDHGRIIGVVVSRWAEGQNLNFATPAQSLTPLLARTETMSLADFGDRTRELRREYDPLAEELFSIGNQHFEHARYEAALERYLLALQRDSTHTSSAYNAAMCLLNLGREAEAEVYLRQYLRLPHDQDEFHFRAVKWLEEHRPGAER